VPSPDPEVRLVELPPDAVRRIEQDQVVWFTTVTDSGVPAPNPVWFIRDGDDLLVYSQPTSRRVHNIGPRPTVTLHFNSDAGGGDVVVITGLAEVAPGRKPSARPAYLAKYEASITGELGTTVDEIDATYDTEIRVHPTKVRLTDG
jgi:PPOX class probable F420-dependent enzyme